MRARHQRSSVKLLNCIGVSLVRLAGAGPTTNGDSKATGSDRLDAVRHPYGRSVRRFLDLYLPRRSFELGCDLAAGHRGCRDCSGYFAAHLADCSFRSALRFVLTSAEPMRALHMRSNRL